MIDTIQGTTAATDQRMLELVIFVDFLGDCDFRIVKASFIDMIISFFPFVGEVSRIMTRSLYHVFNCRSLWLSNVQLTDEAIRNIIESFTKRRF